jgi:radical SAM superfamily enzyme YgiQ (UPF0313 family)
MKILLVQPAGDWVRVEAGRPPLRRAMLRFSVMPLTIVGALTPSRHAVRVVDENVEALDFDADVDLVAVTFMTALAPRAYQIAAAFKARGKTVVAGGYHPTFVPDEVAQHFDAVVVGDAEGQWPQLLADFEAGQLQRTYRRATPCDAREIPAPRRNLVAHTARHYVTADAVQIARGCPHACRYCSITAFHRGTHRTRPLDAVLEEVRGLPRNFMFVDDNIIADREYARGLFRALAPLGKRWVTQCSIEIADDAGLLELAHMAGCRGLFIGLESLDPRNLDGVDKGFGRCQTYAERIARVRRQGIGIVASVIVGLDHDDVTVFERTLRFLECAHVDAVQVNILTPLPGTPLYAQFDREERIVDRDWGRYDFRHAVIRPAKMSAEELSAGADWLRREFYRPARIFRRATNGLLRLGPLPAWLALRLNLTYRRDNRHEGIIGWNPAQRLRRSTVSQRASPTTPQPASSSRPRQRQRSAPLRVPPART